MHINNYVWIAMAKESSELLGAVDGAMLSAGAAESNL